VSSSHDFNAIFGCVQICVTIIFWGLMMWIFWVKVRWWVWGFSIVLGIVVCVCVCVVWVRDCYAFIGVWVCRLSRSFDIYMIIFSWYNSTYGLYHINFYIESELASKCNTHRKWFFELKKMLKIILMNDWVEMY